MRFSSDRDLLSNVSDEIKQMNPELFGVPVKRQAPQAEPVVKVGRKNKYGAQKIEFEGQTFDSKREFRRWLELRELERIGEIEGLKRQVKFILLEPFVYHGQKVQSIVYTADFTYLHDDLFIIEDVKSDATSRNEAFRLRWRLLQNAYRHRPDVRCILTGTKT